MRPLAALACCLLFAACGASRPAGDMAVAGDAPDTTSGDAVAPAELMGPLKARVNRIIATAAAGAPGYADCFLVKKGLPPEVADLWAKRLRSYADHMGTFATDQLKDERIDGDVGVLAVVEKAGDLSPFCLVKDGDTWRLLPYITRYRKRLCKLTQEQEQKLAGLLEWFADYKAKATPPKASGDAPSSPPDAPSP